MKLKMFKKIVSLASAFTIVATCLAGLNFSASAADDDVANQVPGIAENAMFSVKAGDTIKIEPHSGSNGMDGLSVAGNVVTFEDGTDPTKEEILDEEGAGTGEFKTPDTKWVIEGATPGSKSSNAFFRNEKDTSNKTNSGYSLKTVASSDLTKYGMSSMFKQTLGGFKASGQFNNVVDVRLVSKNYTPKKGSAVEEDDDDVDSYGGYSYGLKEGQKVYLSFRLYINPKDVDGPVCTATKATNTPTKGIVFTPPVYATTGGVKTPADLQLDEGKSFKLPFKASAGDSGLTWTSDKPECFTVVNGTVKAIKKGSGSITIKSINNPSNSATVTVEVTPVVTAIRSNVTTLNLITKLNKGKDADGDIQYITVAPKTSTGASLTYNLSLAKGSKGIKFVDNKGKENTKPNAVGGVVTFGVKTTSGFKLEKGEKIVITPVVDSKDKSLASPKTIKPLSITVKTTTYPDYVKNFKETVKADKVTGYREVNVTVGGSAALNLSINPVTALNGFEWIPCDENGAKLDAASNTAKISNNGDVVEGVTPGTCYYKATSVGKDKDGNQVESSIYKINVYKPASSFVFNDGTNSKMVVKGGYLMEASNAEKVCDKKIIGGKRYTFTEPSCGADGEPIVWTSNKPEAVVFAKNGIMNLTVLANEKATYTITGTSQYTKQKYSFKVMAKAPVEGELEEENSEDSFVGAVVDTDGKGTIALKKGEKYQLIPDVAGSFSDAASKDKVTFATDDTTKSVTVNKNTGVITANKATDGVSVTMTCGEYEVNATVVVTEDAATKPVASVSAAYIDGLTAKTITLTAKNAPKNATTEWHVIYNEVKDDEGNVVTCASEKLENNKLEIPAYLTKTTIVVATKKVTGENGDETTENITSVVPVLNTDNKYVDATLDNSSDNYMMNDGKTSTSESIPNSSKTYKVYCVVNGVQSDPVEINAYNGVMKKQPKVVDYEVTDGYSNPVDLSTLKSSKGGIKAGSTFKLPIALETKVTTGTGKNKSTKTYYNDLSVADDEIIWTSSNDYIITGIKPVGDRIGAVELPDGGKVGDSFTVTYRSKYYQEYEFTTSSEYTGKVTLTGITKNGGKKITLTLYVVK